MAIPTFEEMEYYSTHPAERPKAEPLFFQTPEYLKQLARAFDPKSGLCEASPARQAGASAIKPLTALQSEFLFSLPFTVPGNGEVKPGCTQAIHTTLCGVLNGVDDASDEVAEHEPVCGMDFSEVVREQANLPMDAPHLRVDAQCDDYADFLVNQPQGVGHEELDLFYGFRAEESVEGSASSASYAAIKPPGVPPEVLRDLGARYSKEGGQAIMAAVRSLVAEPFSPAGEVRPAEENLLLSAGLGRFLAMCRSDAVEWLESIKGNEFLPDRSVGKAFKRQPLPSGRSWRLGHTHVSVMEVCVESRPSDHDWINSEVSSLALVSRMRLCVRDVDLDRVLWVLYELLRPEKRQFVLVEPTHKWAETRFTRLVPPFPPLPVGLGLGESAPLSQFDMLLAKLFMSLVRRGGSDVPGELCGSCLRLDELGDPSFRCAPC